MAGYILKITIEDTHPPVWRRVVVPDRITFQKLHEIIQVLFGWEDAHLHEFTVPSAHIVIDSESDRRGNHYKETETLIDSFLGGYKWIRYTYDFGDEWRHKIQLEGIDELYTGRTARLLKAKGDNFLEDSGGGWDEDYGNRSSFDEYDAGQRLDQMIFSVQSEMDEEMRSDISQEDLDDTFEDVKIALRNIAEMNRGREFDDYKDEVLEMLLKLAGDAGMSLTDEEPLDMKTKEKVWAGFRGTVKIMEAAETNEALLNSLSEKEASDYSKYLQLPVETVQTRAENVSAIAAEFKQHPEYILYVFGEKEFAELVKWSKLSVGSAFRKISESSTGLKMIALGLGDFSENGETGELRFAEDLKEILKELNAKRRNTVYREIKRFDDRLQKLILVYGMVERESLYRMYCKVFGDCPQQKDFLRLLYWHDRFNDFINTIYTLEGTCYVYAKQLKGDVVLEKMERYASELSYVEFTAGELKSMAVELAKKNIYMEILFQDLIHVYRMDPRIASRAMEDIYSEIMSGTTLPELLDRMQELTGGFWSIRQSTDLWKIASALMLELELPMLKGRSRETYAREKNVSAWTVGMTDDMADVQNKFGTRICEFPVKIQEVMSLATSFGDKESLEKLYRYQEKNRIRSEEFLFLLADAYISFGNTKKGMELIEKFKYSSPRGKAAAEELEGRIQEFWDVMD